MGIKSVLKKNKFLYNMYHNHYIRHVVTEYSDNQKKFMELNREIWNTKALQFAEKVDGIILVRLTTIAPDAFWSVMKKAKAYQEKYGYQICVIMDGRFKDNRNIASIIDSYGDNIYIYTESDDRKKENNRIKKEAKNIAKKIYNSHIDILDFIDTELDGVKVGDLIYDMIIRQNNICTLKECNSSYDETVISAMEKYLFYKNLFSNNNIKVFVTNEYAYTNGIAIRIAVTNGITTECISEFGEITYTMNNIYRYVLDVDNRISPDNLVSKIENDPEFKERCVTYFNNRMTGRINVANVNNAYTSKDNVTQEGVKRRLRIDDSKKTVLIATHIFCDNCHMSEQYIFRDYYDWLEFTLKTLKDRKDLNILIRQHPNAVGYGQFEIDGINQLMSIIPTIISVPQDVSTTMVLELSDVVLTCGGTIGLEAACLGIPAVNVCKSYYSAFGVVDVIKDKEKYKEYLEHITDLKRNHNDKTRVLAQALLYLSSEYRRDTKVKLWEFCILPGADIGKLIELQYEYLNDKLEEVENIKDQEYKKWLQEI